MEKKAAALLGEDVQAGSIVSTAGTGKSMLRSGIADSVGGTLGGALGGAAVGALAGGGTVVDLHGHQGLMYLAVGQTKVAFFTLKQGLLGSSPGTLITTLPRASVASITVGGGTMTSPVAVALADGTELALEVPRVHRGKVERLARLFGPATG